MNVSPIEDVHGLETDHCLVATAAGAVADVTTIRAHPTCSLSAFFIIFQAETAVFSLADVLIIFVST